MRAARAWLTANGHAHRFHDVRKDGLERETLARWADALGWEAVLNRRSATFRALPAPDRADLDRDRALALMERQPVLIKRPVMERGGTVIAGFDAARWAAALG